MKGQHTTKSGAGYTQYWYDRAGHLVYMQDAKLRSKALWLFFVYDKDGWLAIQGVCTGQSAAGLQTGSVVYASDGRRSVSAFYYDYRGNVTECRERTWFGTLRVTENTYTYTGQPLTSKVTGDGATVYTENTYDSGSGLLTATDVKVNDVKQRVSAIVYDDLGRIASVTRGEAGDGGGTVSYGYNIHGQTTEINGPGFTQRLHYADGPGYKLYNGSVSSMEWTMGNDPTVRGYAYAYNGYGWLSEAAYGEGSGLTANKGRYTEKTPAFTRNGGITRLQRNGLRADGTYGKVDDLTVSYTGNRMTGVTDAAPAVTTNGSMDFPVATAAMEWNAWGALVKDGSRGIASIDYDNFGNPLKITYAGGGTTQNVYSATGEKLQTVHRVPMAGAGKLTVWPSSPLKGEDSEVNGLNGYAVTTMQYRGAVVLRDGAVEMVRFPGGYATPLARNVTFHYYTQDYLGSNRAVVNGTTGAVEQTVAYYPYGGVIPDLGNPTTGQPYRFGGKELVTTNGLNEYDFGARQYSAAVPCFTRIDQMAGKYPWLSPYIYCANNPVNLVDPTGMVWSDPKEAEVLVQRVNDRIEHLQTVVAGLEDLLQTNLKDDIKESTNILIKENQEKITLLQGCIKTIGIMGEDKDHIYAIETTDGNRPHMVTEGNDGEVIIQASSDSMALHEITHVGQSLKQGSLVFQNGALTNASTKIGGIARNEIIAYRTQYAMDQFNMPVPVLSIGLITPKFLQVVINPQTNKPLYPYLQ